MPIVVCQADRRPGFKFGPTGKCFTFARGNRRSMQRARALAARQGRAIEANKLDEIVRFLGLKQETSDIRFVIGRLRGRTTTSTQSVIFLKSGGWTRSSARAWLRRNNLKSGSIRETSTSFRAEQRPVSAFQRGSFRTIPAGRSRRSIGKGVSIKIIKVMFPVHTCGQKS